MAMQVIRVSGAVHKDVSQLAAKRGVKMSEIGDEIVTAGLAALSAVGGVEARTLGQSMGEAEPLDVDGHLREALDAETMRLVRDRRKEIAERARAPEIKTLAETAADLITTGWNRLVALHKHQREAAQANPRKRRAV